jgi:hypothetical protein
MNLVKFVIDDQNYLNKLTENKEREQENKEREQENKEENKVEN